MISLCKTVEKKKLLMKINSFLFLNIFNKKHIKSRITVVSNVFKPTLTISYLEFEIVLKIEFKI